jgi:hypothetical protein
MGRLANAGIRRLVEPLLIQALQRRGMIYVEADTVGGLNSVMASPKTSRDFTP